MDIALTIAEKLNADIEQIIDLKKRKGPLVYLISSKDAVFKKLTKIKPIEKTPQNYDLVVIGTPIWASNMTPAIRTYLTNAKIKKAAFFCTCEGTDTRRAFTDMHELIIDAKLVATLRLTIADIKKGKQEKIDEFVEKIK